jgi:ketosteroid isomerase-like protein
MSERAESLAGATPEPEGAATWSEVVGGHAETEAARVRLTLGLRKRDGRWLVVHEHPSAPLP